MAGAAARARGADGGSGTASASGTGAKKKTCSVSAPLEARGTQTRTYEGFVECASGRGGDLINLPSLPAPAAAAVAALEEHARAQQFWG